MAGYDYDPVLVDKLAWRVVGFEHTLNTAQEAERAARKQAKMAKREWARALREWSEARFGPWEDRLAAAQARIDSGEAPGR